MKLGEFERVKNRNRKVGAARHYHVGYVDIWDEHAKRPLIKPVMLTDADLKRVVKRAMENPEDIPVLERPGCLASLFGWE